MSYRYWSPEEVKKLKKDYPTTPNQKLANQLNRTIDSIKSKAYEYDLRKEYFGQDKKKEVVYLREVYCADCMNDPNGCGKCVENCLKQDDGAQKYVQMLKEHYIVKIRHKGGNL